MLSKFLMPQTLRRAAAVALIAACPPLLAACAEGGGLNAGLVPEQQVQAMGQDAWRAMLRQEPISRSNAYQARAERVANQVLAASGQNPAAWEVVVFRGNEANAFALPGGKIGIYEGMMRLAETDAKLAAVLAHEVAHVTADHHVSRVNNQAATQLGVELISTALGAADIASPQTAAQILGTGAQFGVVLPHSRHQELEADRLGLMYMARAGFDPRASIALWQEMQSQGGEPPQFLSTHPSSGSRIERLRELMPEALQVYQASVN